jgi:filamentous hemagglutinin family protein
MIPTKKALLPALLLAATAAHAQIATDGSVGARVAFDRFTRAVVIPESLGLRVGPNLLHSFATFNVASGQTATFTGVGFVQNLIARVTGGTASSIEGTIASSIPGSNLFLINPAGIVFGPGAAIDVPGSFHASSGHYLKLADGTRIAATADPNVTLTFAPPTAFGFEGSAAPILLAGAQLRVREGQRISLAGGDVSLRSDGARTSLLFAPSGTVGIVAAQSAGEAVIADEGLRAEGFGAMGQVAVRDTVVSVVEGAGRRGGGAISIAGGEVALEHATLNANTVFAPGRGIAISAASALHIDASEVLSVTRGAGDAGRLALLGRDITISGGSLVDTSCDPGCTSGAGGALSIEAGGRLAIVGDNLETPTYVVSNSFGGGRTGAIDIRAGTLEASGNALIQGIALASGDGSTITLATGSISLTNGAQVDVSTRGSGRGGTLVVNNAGAIRIEGTRVVDAEAGNKAPSGFFSNAESSGLAGGIVVSTASLEVLGGGEVSSSARRGSTGAGGRIAITASGIVRVSGTDAEGKSSGIVSNTFTGADAGDIEITADSLSVEERGRIQVQSEGPGHAGSARISARTMTLASQGQVSSDARSTGDGGQLEVHVTELLAIEGGNSGLFAKTYGPARGGSVIAEAGEVRLSGGGGIFAGTDGRGTGGDLRVRAQRIEVATDARISVESLVTGLAGSIDVAAGDTLTLADGGRITTSARQADGGNVNVASGRFMRMDGGRITTEVGTGQGSGGNVELQSPVLVMRGSTISANAFGGDGGNIHIGAGIFLPSADSAITASSTLGIDGIITFDSPALDPTGELLVPPPAFIDAGSVLAGRCGPRLAGRASSLVVAPHATLAEAPDGWRFAALPAAPWLRPLACLARTS